MRRLTTALLLAVATSTLPCSSAAAASAPPIRPTLEHLQVRHPGGPGPFPATMLVPVCSGMSKKGNVSHYREIGDQLIGIGYLVAHVDYVAARRLTEACGSFVSPDEIAQDVFTVARHLRSLQLVDPSRIDAIGESLGGGGVLAALSRAGSGDGPPFRRGVVFYPVCRGVAPPRARVELLMLFGGLDGMTPAESCQQIGGQQPRPDGVQVRVYPEARHGFNLSHLPSAAPTGRPDMTPAYHPVAARAAWEEAVKFLKR